MQMGAIESDWKRDVSDVEVGEVGNHLQGATATDA